jgi:hypothetical protein
MCVWRGEGVRSYASICIYMYGRVATCQTFRFEVCIYIYIHICIYTCIYIHICIHKRICVVKMIVCMYVYAHTEIYVHLASL